MSAEAGALLAQTLADLGPQKQGQGFYVGQVLEAGGGRLRISCVGLQLEKEDLWVNPYLDYRWTYDNGEVNLLRKGDRVTLQSLDGQDYYLTGKAVRA